jgi:hypothetical protein
MCLIPKSLTLCLPFQPMDVRRLERRTSSMSTMRSNQLSYTSLRLLTITLTNLMRQGSILCIDQVMTQMT